MMRVGLVSCGKRKLDHAAAVREMYTGSLFKAAREYASSNYDSWFVISAKYGLVHPDKVIEPYDLTMADLTYGERCRWAGDVLYALSAVIPSDAHLFVHAGAAYRNALFSVPATGWLTEVPLQGLSIGKQLAWYKQHRVVLA